MVEFAWHLHHDVLVEPLIGTLEERVRYIEAMKPSEEQRLRLRLLKLVKGELPSEVVEASIADVEAWKVFQRAVEARGVYESSAVLGSCEEAYQTYCKTIEAYNDVLAAHRSEVEELHRQECPNCPWNGKTIFT